ncbi:MAG: UDP-N-acetylglucosamine 2-epimerase (non-hydrolyzing) [Bacteroidetes bacterium]|nr:UDP-N-acetylglucosamine 2-epimerase (non-hydrolyzing) [Bacteroidota bacterium]
MKILTIIGARPQIIKAAALSRAIRNEYSGSIREIILHTGQHYDRNMSQVFIDEMEIPRPDYNLEVGSGTHGVQTGRMIMGIEEVLLKENPDYLVLFGDTNSTLAGAVAGSKLHIPVVHIEAGLRSFNKNMPEEINRIVCDHASTLLFSPTMTGFHNLVREGFNPTAKPPYNIDNPGIYHCGDIMFDNSLYFADLAGRKSQILDQMGLKGDSFILSTIHRDNNTDEPGRLEAIIRGIIAVAEIFSGRIVLPLHPRTAKILKERSGQEPYNKFLNHEKILITDPVSFLDIILLEKNAELIMTDSGGVQKEAYFFEKPCIILRSETEWKEIVEAGAGIVTDASEERILEAYKTLTAKNNIEYPRVFGDGHAAGFICKAMLSNK